MEGTRYSKLETNNDSEEDCELVHRRRRQRLPKFLTSLRFASLVGFCFGMLAMFGGSRLRENIGKGELDWLSESLLRGNLPSGCSAHKKLIEPPGDIKVLFEYNETYSGPPTMESEYAWLDLMPGKAPGDTRRRHK